MTAQQVAEEVQRKIVPQLQELGFEAFALTGYLSDGEGKIQKVTVGHDGNNPAYADGIRPMLQAAVIWAKGGL